MGPVRQFIMGDDSMLWVYEDVADDRYDGVALVW